MRGLEWGPLCVSSFLCISVLGVASGPGVGSAGCEGAITHPPPLRWFALLAVLGQWSRCRSYSLVLCVLFYEAICCMSYLVLCFKSTPPPPPPPDGLLCWPFWGNGPCVGLTLWCFVF